MKRQPILILIFMLLALPLMVACGDADDRDSASPTDPGGAFTSPTSSPATPTPEPPEPAASATEVVVEPSATPSETAVEATATENADTLILSAYFMRDEQLAATHREIPHTLAVGTAAMEALLAGPTDFEAEAGFVSAIPDGTEFLGLEIEDEIATVDLSAEFESGGGSVSMVARLAQVTFTLTQFPTVESVEFLIEGEPADVFGGEGLVLDQPVERAQFEEILPAIFVESPTVGDRVESPLRIWGTANTFEATFMVNVVDPGGMIIVEEVVTATSGTGTRGTFDVTLDFEPTRDGMGAVIVFERSARDGEPIHVVEIPVEMTT